MQLLAKTLHGLEEVLAKELEELGAEQIRPMKRSVQFEGDLKMLYKANLHLRTSIRVLMPIKTFRVRNEDELYAEIQKIDWSTYMDYKDTLAINGVVSSQYFNHSKYIALKSKDAIVDQFRDTYGRRPNVNTDQPTLRINIHIGGDLCTVSLDSSGDSLHMRGYRQEAGEAPINEVLAAGMIMLSGWEKDCNFIDPMCGSGTILVEAASYACNYPPNLNRKQFGFHKWKDFDSELWSAVVQEGKDKIVNFEYKVLGADLDFKTIRMAGRNVDRANLPIEIDIQRKQFEKFVPPYEKGILMTNPPYDERLQIEDIHDFYAMMGDKFKQEFAGYTAWLISSNMEAIKHIGLRPSRRIELYNGKLPCKFLKYEMYAGSKKGKYMDKEEED